MAQLRIVRVNPKFQSNPVDNLAEGEVKNLCQEFEFLTVNRVKTEQDFPNIVFYISFTIQYFDLEKCALAVFVAT